MKNIDVRNELEDYGDDMPVIVEDMRGRRYKAEIDTVNTSAGPVITFAAVGDPVDDPNEFFED